MNNPLTIETLKTEAKKFCETQSGVYRQELFGVTDGKAIGTFVEHLQEIFIREEI